MISVNIITLGRPSLYKTLQTVFEQKIAEDFEINLILQGEIDEQRLKAMNSLNRKVNVYIHQKGLGFGYYRNEAIKKTQGDILAWIDDDEWTKNDMWLESLTLPIRTGTYKVVTAGTDIELGKGYFTDCITYLGYPGGSVIGFDKMWTVYNDSTTEHLCSGNFAFHRDVLEYVPGFEEGLKSGAEDVAFATMISEHTIKIYYEPRATIYHVHRSGIVNFCKWHFLRGKSVYEYMKLGLVKGSHKKDKMRSLKYILFGRLRTKYVFGIRMLFGLQYLFTLLGYVGVKLIYKN